MGFKFIRDIHGREIGIACSRPERTAEEIAERNDPNYEFKIPDFVLKRRADEPKAD